MNKRNNTHRPTLKRKQPQQKQRYSNTLQNRYDYSDQEYKYKQQQQYAHLQQGLIKQYQHIINGVDLNRKYFQNQMEKQINKCQNYFNQLVNIIQQQKNTLITQVRQIIKTIKEQCGIKIGSLQNKKSNLQKNRYKIYDQKSAFRERNQCQTQKYLPFTFFQIHFAKQFNQFKDDIKKYFQLHKINPFLQEGKPNMYQCSQQKTKQICSQKSYDQQDLDKLTQISDSQSNFIDDLSCDQELNWQDQNKVIKTKKYKHMVQEIIPEATQSKQNSIVLSNYQSIYQ